MLQLKRFLLLFWSLWLTLVVAGNVCDALKELGYLGDAWRFNSGNYRFMIETTNRYDKPAWLDGFLFLGVILWETAAAVLFWLAWWEGRSKRAADARLLAPAFSVGLMLWGGFLLADEFFIAYPVGSTHRQLFIAQLITLLALYLLPEKADYAGAGG